MKNYKYDSEIADLVHCIMGNGTLIVETINEALLVEYFRLRGTPMRIKSSLRDFSKQVDEVFSGPAKNSIRK